MTSIDVTFQLAYPSGKPYVYEAAMYESYESDVQAQLAGAIITKLLDAPITAVNYSMDAPEVEVCFETDVSFSEVQRLISADPVLRLLSIQVWDF